VADARWSAGWALVFIALLYLTAPAVGAMARFNITDQFWPQGTSGEPVSVETIASDPEYDWMATWQKTGMLGWEDKNGDGKIAYFNDKDADTVAKMEAAGWGSQNELTNFNRDILVLANPEIANLPGWVIGLVAAGGLAAALSTAAGLLLAISSAVSHDLLKGQLTPNMTEKSELLSARIAMAVAIAVATYLGLNPPGFAAQTVALAFGLAAATIFPALMMGIFTKVNNKGAVAGMIAGLVVTVVYIFLHKGWLFIPDTNSFTDADPLLGTVKSTSFGAIGALINFGVAFAVSKVTDPIPTQIEELVESVRIPAGAGVAVDH
jgi:cation/acetate symporter